jgi:hypothetical protein
MRALGRMALMTALGGFPVGCELIAGVRDLDLTGGADSGVDAHRSDSLVSGDGVADHAVSDEGPSVGDASDGDAETSTPDAAEPVVVLQHHACTYSTQPDTFGCQFPAKNVAGNAFLVHFYFNYGSASVAVNKLFDDDSNVYHFLDVGDVDCPAGELGDEVCCTMPLDQGTCEGWALATNVDVTAENPATVTFAITGSSTGSDVMGADVLEISGLAKAPLDQAKAMGTPSAATMLSTPAIVTSFAGELIVAGFAAYSSGSTDLTVTPGWGLDPDPGYFAATEFIVGGPAGSKYSVTGAITGTTPQSGTSTILALKPR